MTTFELEGKSTLTDKERESLQSGKKLPIIYDEDSPQLTEKMEQAFIAARKAKPYRAG